ncbi:MAG: fused MFS/spermidine synthase [Candidatus Marinimicrobia bacterium]|nr:fused MFS/spermidine synthase [Candidatus Neomarinimicrobiota bacterium]
MSFSFFPRTVCKTNSKISGEIKIKEHLGQYTLQVQNLTQSGGIIKSIWQKPLKKIIKANQVLILGLGGGTAIQLIKERFPVAKITALEIDEEIIKISKKYFGLGKVKDLEIINEDAIKWIKNYQENKFDLMLVDMYVGGRFPQKAMENEFLQKLKKILTPQGKIVLNWLKNKSERRLFEKLEKSFAQIEEVNTPTNLFFFCY